ncbi:MAG: UvrD-helicase domain-containing protein [Chitinispirillia bacterium]|nr:UvrD-helicase domain-containing protein [Chitinispirillia bacterium]MCL2242195.1 UvrD-helicase domain-containing protein [Chitinispirillia bacterium]
MSNGQVLSSPKDIDLGRHGVIEAHAGTGKTYTIVKLVLRMLEEPPKGVSGLIHLRNILLVTYTEKAAGELKERIREGIAGRIAELNSQGVSNKRLAEHLSDCLNNMHEAHIGTIHSVCLRLLQTWPFETGVHFSTQIIDDNDGVDALLRESMRTDWYDEPSLLPTALSALEEMGIKLTSGKHLKLIRKTALELLADDGRKIDDDALNNTASIENTVEALRGVKDDLNAAEAGLIEKLQAYIDLLTALLGAGRLEQKKLDVIEGLISSLKKMCDSGIYDTNRLSKPMKCDGHGNTQIFAKSDIKNIPEYAGVIETLAGEISGHDYLKRSEELTALQSRHILAITRIAAEKLSARYTLYKREKGFVSYGDMLHLMRDALCAPNSAVLAGLRQRLRYGIIDEFQDTSVIQWSIFRKIFLDGGVNAKMYIVGDPKQSIYSFQNADILSYISAKETVTGEHGGTAYSLVNNYRSLPEMIAAYNAILSPKSGSAEDWFIVENIAYPDSGAARAPAERADNPEYVLRHKPVQIVDLDTDNENKRTMHGAARAAIQILAGTAISVPHGNGWKNLTLNYSDFAVIVETHALAEPFIEEFREHRIPCVKYKLAGVFNSPVARDLIAILTAINKRYSRAPRAAALLTHFFNRQARSISLKDDLEPCGNPRCSGDKQCLAHALDTWGKLADNQRWAQLFRSIIEKTGVRERLVRLIDGERKLADLRQVVDYCMEYLYGQSSSIELLIDHLERLYNNTEEADADKNIHTLSTEKSSVRILTMHAAKGLEFPVVFLARSKNKRELKGPDVLPWTAADGIRRFTPFLAKEDLKASGQDGPLQSYENDQRRERRRLLYVAMTRPQAMLFIPMRKEDEDISPRLRYLLDNGNSSIELFDEERFAANCEKASKQKVKSAAQGAIPDLKDIPKLSLQHLISRETSYSQLSKILKRGGADGDGYLAIDLNSGNDDVMPDCGDGSPTRQALPGSNLTGNALHKAIEALLGRDNVCDILGDAVELDKIVKDCLERGGVLNLPQLQSPEAAANAVAQAAAYVRSALTTRFPIPGGGEAAVAELGRADRRAEAEFLMRSGRHRIRGFMDLVFRLKNDRHPAHPWRYYFLDWKSDTLKSYDCDAVKHHCEAQNYTLQAQIYALALDKYLSGILGGAYSREQNLGGWLYVFLRGKNSYWAENLKNFTFDDADIYIIERCFPSKPIYL